MPTPLSRWTTPSSKCSTQAQTVTAKPEFAKESHKNIQGWNVFGPSIAFGLGVNVTDVDVIINWGPPKDIMEYWQEAGSAGRDGRKSISLLYQYPRSVIRSRTDPSMVELISNISEKRLCIRNSLLKTFELLGLSVDTIPKNHRCCSNCQAQEETY